MRQFRWVLLVFVSLMLPTSSRTVEPTQAEAEPGYQGKTLAEWIEDLKDSKKDNHSAAAQALAVFGPKKESISALADALKDGDRTVILQAAQTLGKFGPRAREALPALRAAFKKLGDDLPRPDNYGGPRDNSELERLKAPHRAVAQALILIDDHPGPEMASILLEILEAGDADKRRDIVIRLGKLGPDAAKTTVPALISVLASADSARSGQTAILRGSGEPTREEIQAIRLEAVKSLGRIGPAAKPALHALTLALKLAAPEKGSGMQLINVSAESATSPHADVVAIPVTITGPNGDKAMLRACAEALGRIRPETKGSVGALRLAFRDLDEGVRWAALCALLESDQDTKEVVPILQNCLQDKDAVIRRVAVEVLVKSEGEKKKILSSLTAALTDDDPSVRESAVRALGEMGTKGKQAIPALIAALKNRDAKVRAAAAEALGRMGVADKEVIPALVAALRDKEITVFREAGKALGKFGPRSKAAVPGLLVILDDSNAKKRTMTCLVLNAVGPAAKETIPALEKLSQNDAAECVRLAARGALAKIDSSRLKANLPRLMAALRSEDYDVFEVAEISLTLLGRDAPEIVDTLRVLRDETSDANVKNGYEELIEAILRPAKNPFDW